MKFAMVFPGQGSQSVGMLQGYGESAEVQEVLAVASEALKQDIGKLIAEGPAEELNRTVNTQPVMLTAGFAAYRLWRALDGPEPDIVAGHSLGEYTALVAAGALDFADALPLVRFRAQAMQEAVPQGEGAMAAVLGLDDDAVRAACAEAAEGQVVEPVNYNAPSQVVIAGHAAAVERAMAAAKARGAKRTVRLPVSAPFHSSLLAPAAARLGEVLADVAVRSPRIPVLHNVDVKTYSEPDQVRDALVRQANHPVRWVETVRAMAAGGVTHIAECGPGKVLAPLVKRIVDGVEGIPLTDRDGIEVAIAAVKGG
ncbi:MAG: ACP S-malonyltransferase [Betaproteobacteria bacterium]|jgi:[acyl-carrier-protein] S-malonyltransferase|nr:ACP S-malonyltransferase [Betaproteobacteria bacterium]